MKPHVLTEPYIRALKVAPAGQRYAVADALCQRFRASPGCRLQIVEEARRVAPAAY